MRQLFPPRRIRFKLSGPLRPGAYRSSPLCAARLGGARRVMTSVPEEIAVATKPALMRKMIGEDFDTGIPCAFVLTGNIYGLDSCPRCMPEVLHHHSARDPVERIRTCAESFWRSHREPTARAHPVSCRPHGRLSSVRRVAAYRRPVFRFSRFP